MYGYPFLATLFSSSMLAGLAALLVSAAPMKEVMQFEASATDDDDDDDDHDDDDDDNDDDSDDDDDDDER